MNIDESRIGTTGGEIHKGGFQKKYVGDKVDYGKGKGVETDKTPQGRFPANLIHDGSDEAVEPFFKTNKQAKYKSASCFFYCAKASKKERNIGLKGFEKKNTSHDGRNKHIENPYQRHNNIQYNYHPTVKPIKLMKYLVRLVTPKDGIVLDPFMGSGTTGMACKKEGFRFIGIELDKKYCKIAEARIKSY
ncbi:MAG: site-specific DNA-methyltransferase [Actinobacteria bacterium]|nr:site-specific DNA-methyltransferase [Actinomycetota bacterium]